MGTKRSVILKQVEHRILLIRGQKVLLDADLAHLYGVSTKRLNEQVKRNGKRFPTDFAFRLTVREKREVVANCDHLQGLRFSPGLPYAFTEHGAVMLATVLRSARAARVSVFVVRAFVKMRRWLSSRGEALRRLDDLEREMGRHSSQIRSLFDAVRQMMAPPVPPRRRIGFRAG